MFTGDLFQTYLILIPGVTWVITQGLKVLISGRHKKVSTFGELFKSGGMPSSHSSFMTSLTTAIGLEQGMRSSLFILALCLTAIVIYDAINVRLESGKHAAILNEFVGKNPASIADHKHFFPLETSLGHTALEAFVGGLLGIALGALLYFA